MKISRPINRAIGISTSQAILRGKTTFHPTSTAALRAAWEFREKNSTNLYKTLPNPPLT